jgi:hypothetical protein
VAVDDLITLASGDVGTYDGADNRILSIADDRNSFVLSGTYSSDDTGGTAQLDLSSIEVVYQVMAQITGTDSVVSILPGTGDKVVYVNRDPKPNLNIGTNRKLYFKIANAATYRIAVDASLTVAGEG